MTKHNSKDSFYKFMIKMLGIYFHWYLGYEGSDIEFINGEFQVIKDDDKICDIVYKVDGKVIFNIEVQSEPVYDDKMIDIYKYHIRIEVFEGTSVKSVIFGLYKSTQGIASKKIDFGMEIEPDVTV